MKTILVFNIIILCSILSLTVNCQNQPKPASLILTPFAMGLNDPVDISNSGDNRLFIVEQAGYIRIIDASGNVDPDPYLDIHERVQSGGEQGLLGLAFHPGYSENGFFYVNYTGDGDSTHISRFTVSAANPDSAAANSEMKLMTIFQPFQNHNGGELSFGPDGYLYIGLGDGGAAGDPGNRAQNPMEYLGKMLRIDVDADVPYGIPPGNPFNGSLSTLNEIWALGLRNPWRFSFDRLTGDLWIGDVGQNNVEEIDFQPVSSTGGENYGWRCYEGNNPYNTENCLAQNNYTFPVHAYTHAATGSCSVTGGFVYRGSQYPAFYGKYFFADYCSGIIWTLFNVSGNWVAENMGQFSGNNFSTFGEDSQGRLFIAGHTNGIIYRVDETGTGADESRTESVINIYPNPFTNELVMENGATGFNPEDEVIIMNSVGQRVYHSGLTAGKSVLSIGFLPGGIYFVKFWINGVDTVEKIVKQ
jgi:glucose/arabinose dehydrogenase